MKTAPSLVLFAILFSWLTMAKAQERAPHGLVYESPLALSPQAYDFFHPNSQTTSAKTPLHAHSRAPLPMAATVQSDVAHESVSSTANGDHDTRLKAGGIAGIVLGAGFFVVSVIGVLYVVITRKNNLKRTASDQPAPVQTV